MSHLLTDLGEDRAVIADEANWCEEVLARDSDGDETAPCESDAVCWCAVGALEKWLGECEDFQTRNRAAATALDKAAESMCLMAGLTPVDTIVEINDNFGHGKVLECYDRAIANVKKFKETAA